VKNYFFFEYICYFIQNLDGQSVSVYTDGACSKNGKIGASAGIGVYFGENHRL
jgi:hypothetical protein